MNDSFAKRNPEPFSELPKKLITIEVTVVLQKTVIGGLVQFHEQQRVLDIFNRGIVGPWQKANQNFIAFTDAVISDINGNVLMKAPSLFVAKHNILFVMETAGINNIYPSPRETSVRPHPFRDKKPVPVTLNLPTLVLEGIMYTEEAQQLNIVLEQENAFIAMTNITIKPNLGTGIHSARFAAVNKHHILYLSAIEWK
jgi:hypothetical protein